MIDLVDPMPVSSPIRGLRAIVTPPGSKSITNRVYLLASLAEGKSRIVWPLRSDDTDRLLAALGTLGVGVRWEDDELVLEGVGGRFPYGGRIDLGDGGTPARFMIAAACLADDEVIVDGSPRMRERPVSELIDMLRLLGADIVYVDVDGHLPIRTRPARLGGAVDVGQTASSQFISALLLTAPAYDQPLILRVNEPLTSAPYVEMTLETMMQWGIEVEETSGGYKVTPQPSSRQTFPVPPDASSAVYLWAAGAIVPGSRVKTPRVLDGAPQPDRAFLSCLQMCGADVHHAGSAIEVTCRGRLRPPDSPFDMRDLPDAAVCLAAISLAADRPMTITGLQTLKVKESDRIEALATELRRCGCTVDTTDDSIRIDPRTQHEGSVVIETYDDHRMAMAFAVAGLARPGLSIADPGCVRKSYPGFWDDLDRLCRSGPDGS